MKKNIISKGANIAYLLSNVDPAEDAFLLLAPGAEHSEFFNDIFNKYKGTKTLLVPDYPGRGDSPPQDNNSNEEVARTINELVTSLDLNNVTVIAYSYGTQIAIELVKKMGENIKSYIL